MISNVIAFPKRRAPDISARATDEHLLVALTHRDALMTVPGIERSIVDCRCVVAGFEGLAEYLKSEFPGISNENVADYLRVALTTYLNLKLGVIG